MRRPARVQRRLAVLLAAVTFPPLALVIALGGSAWGIAQCAALCAVPVALAATARWRRFALVALGAFVALGIVHTVRAGRARGVRMVRLPAATTAVPVLAGWFDERDAGLAAAWLSVATGRFRDRDAREFVPAMRATYGAMRGERGVVPSAVLRDHLGVQSDDAFDTLVIEPIAQRRPANVVVFLHGFGGNVTAFCWQFARLAHALDARTVCPSLDGVGRWSTPEGLARVRTTLVFARTFGPQRIVLAGLSNGAIGASRIVNDVGAVDALVLISGAADDAPAPHVPTLVVEGVEDANVPVVSTRAYVANADASTGAVARVTSVEVPAAHVMLIAHGDAIERAIGNWWPTVPLVRTAAR